jgi:hypothetical protein
MRRVAICTILGNWLVFPQEWSAFFRMTLVASLNDRVFLQQLRACRTMWVVAIRTSYLALLNGVVRDFFVICALLFVAGVANFSLSFFAQHFVSRLMHLVAAVTGHAVVLVLTAIPIGTLLAFVASQALIRAFFVARLCISTFLKQNIRRCTAFDFGVALHVLVALAVARLASWGARITAHTVLGLIERQDRGCFAFVMTACADCVFLQGCFGHNGLG